MPRTWRDSALAVYVFVSAVLLLYANMYKPLERYDGSSPRGPYAVSYGKGMHWHSWDHVENLFVFGDSWTETEFDPNGDQPTASNPLGNPAWDPSNWHITGGEIWIKFLTAVHNKTFIKTANLAHGGATVDLDLIHPFSSVLPGMTDLEDQVEKSFKQYESHPDYMDWTADNSLFIVWMGMNDIHNANEETHLHFPRLFEEYLDDIDRLYRKGARNFLLMNVPPLELSPLAEKEDRVLDWTDWVLSWNRNLTALTGNFTRSHPEATTYLFDTYNLFQKAIQEPSHFPETKEIKDTKTACDAYSFGTEDFDTKDEECEYRVDEYLWMNHVHPTTRMYNLTAVEVAKALGVRWESGWVWG